jgi:hypothetical protein
VVSGIEGARQGRRRAEKKAASTTITGLVKFTIPCLEALLTTKQTANSLWSRRQTTTPTTDTQTK